MDSLISDDTASPNNTTGTITEEDENTSKRTRNLANAKGTAGFGKAEVAAQHARCCRVVCDIIH